MSMKTHTRFGRIVQIPPTFWENNTRPFTTLHQRKQWYLEMMRRKAGTVMNPMNLEPLMCDKYPLFASYSKRKHSEMKLYNNDNTIKGATISNHYKHNCNNIIDNTLQKMNYYSIILYVAGSKNQLLFYKTAGTRQLVSHGADWL